MAGFLSYRTGQVHVSSSEFTCTHRNWSDEVTQSRDIQGDRKQNIHRESVRGSIDKSDDSCSIGTYMGRAGDRDPNNENGIQSPNDGLEWGTDWQEIITQDGGVCSHGH